MMERSISATDANREFSRVLGEVSAGQTFVVTAHGKPVARMVPVTAPPIPNDDQSRRVHALVDELLALPLRAPGRITRDDGYE
jgi:prevent-host-death family protein